MHRPVHHLLALTLAAVLSISPAAPGWSYAYPTSLRGNTAILSYGFETEAFSPRAAWVRNYVRDSWNVSFDFFDRLAEKTTPLPVSGPRVSSHRHGLDNVPSGAEVWRPDNTIQMSRDPNSSEGRHGDRRSSVIIKFRESIPFEYKHLASNEKVQRLYDVLGDEAVLFIQESLTNASITRKTTEGSVLILAAHFVERYLEANADTEVHCLNDLSKLFKDLYPKRHSQKEIADWVAQRDAATADQQNLRGAMCRALSIPADRVVFVDPNDEWLMSFFGLSGRSPLGPSRHVNGMHRLLYENEGTSPEKLILVLADRSDFETLRILAHEGSHWLQSEEMLTAMHDDNLTRFLGEGFQRYREFAGITRMAKDAVAGRRVRELVEEAFTAVKNPPSVASFEETLWVTINLDASAAYATETALVRTLVGRIGIDRMLAYFLSGNRQALASGLNNMSMELLEYFFMNWQYEFDGTIDVRQRLIPMAIAMHLASIQNVGDDHRHRLTIVLDEIDTFMDNVVQKERIARSVFDCFDPHVFLPLLDAFMAGEISDATFHGQLIHGFRLAATRPRTAVQLSDWLPDLYKIDKLPDASALFPADNSTEINRIDRSKPPSGGAGAAWIAILDSVERFLNFHPRSKTRNTVWPLRAA